jgi:hypothetical protein
MEHSQTDLPIITYPAQTLKQNISGLNLLLFVKNTCIQIRQPKITTDYAHYLLPSTQ